MVTVGWSFDEMAERVALDIPEGWYVNLGIGLPTRVSDVMSSAREVIFHSENGILGMKKLGGVGASDRDLINAGKDPVELREGGCYVSHSDSFCIVRGGHLDLAIMGAYEVSARGDLANWCRADGMVPAVGGAMDLAAGARRVWVMMSHTTSNGREKIVDECSLPITARGVVDRVYTNLCVMESGAGGLSVIEVADGVSESYVRAHTRASLRT